MILKKEEKENLVVFLINPFANNLKDSKNIVTELIQDQTTIDKDFLRVW